jgi:hypothetical protein
MHALFLFINETNVSISRNFVGHEPCICVKIRTVWDIAPCRQYAPLKRRSTPTEPHGAIS